jgi:hypothetical protein
VRAFFRDLADGAWMLGLDLRHSDARVAEPALVRSATGAMLYLSTFKKSLLQSLPYVPAALALLGLAHPRDRRPLALTALAALVPFGAFAALRWHGGMSFNLRYLLPALPFTSILTAVALRRCIALASPRVVRNVDLLMLLAVLAYLATLAALGPQRAVTPFGERFFLDTPLVLAALVAGSAIAVLASRGRARSRLASVLLACSALSMSWAACVAFTYDAPATASRRAESARHSAAVRPLVPAGSLLFVDVADSFAGLLDKDVQMAHFAADASADLGRLTRQASRAGRSVYLASTRGSAEAHRTIASASGIDAVILRARDPAVLRLTPRAPSSWHDAPP